MENAAVGLSLTLAQAQTRRPGSRKGSGRRRTPLTTLKIAALAPMPRASVIKATAVKPGRLARRRSANTKSGQKSCIVHLRENHFSGCIHRDQTNDDRSLP